MEDTCPSHRDSPAVPARCHHCAALRLWARVPQTTRTEVDALLRRRAVVPAVAALRAGMPDGAPPLRSALDAVLERRRWLAGHDEAAPPASEPGVDAMVAAVVAAGAPAVAVEICWDGDRRGWIEDLIAVVARPGPDHPHFDEVPLWSYRSPGAAERGQVVARRLGVPFHFEHAGTPDIDLPRWWDRCGSEAQHAP